MPSLKIPDLYLAILWFCAVTVSCATTFSQVCFFRADNSRPLAHQAGKPGQEFSADAMGRSGIDASRIEKYLNERVQTLADLDKTDWTRMPDSHATYLTRPSVQLRSTSILGDKRAAVIAVEGEKQTAVVGVGDEIAGVKILEITPTGINCEWREQKFFVPIN